MKLKNIIIKWKSENYSKLDVYLINYNIWYIYLIILADIFSLFRKPSKSSENDDVKNESYGTNFNNCSAWKFRALH